MTDTTSEQIEPAIAFASMSRTVPKQNYLRNFLMSEECAEMAQLVANLARRTSYGRGGTTSPPAVDT